MDKHIEVIGIDHGWSNMKTASQIFTTGVREITTEPAFTDDLVKFDGKYYKVGGKRLEVKNTKVENDNFYILTLAAMAKELCRRGMRNANVLLSVGLPLTRFGAEKQDFISYLSRNKEIKFLFENKEYSTRIARVSVFPQCYAAVADRLRTLPERVVVVDIGSWTIDIMPIRNGKPDEAECITSQQGLIRCMRSINEECNRQIGQELEETVIQSVMATGKAALPEDYMVIVESCLREFAEKVYNTLKEHGYNLDVTPIVFVGGGASVMRLFGMHDSGNIQYIEDVKANAKGFEQLGKIYLSKHRNEIELGVTLMGKPNISYHSVRLNLDNEQHRRVHRVLAELNTEIHKSVNQFLIDAADFYIRSFEDENLLKEAESRKDKGAEYISRSDLDGIREELKSEVKNEIILLLGAALSKGAAAGVGMAEQTVGMAAESKKEPESDATMEGLVDDWG